MKAHEALELLHGLLLGQGATPPEQVTTSRRRGEMVQAAKNAVALRVLRRQVMGPQFSNDPCWDLLLCLYQNWADGARISVTDLAYETSVPTATVTRWLSALAAQDMVDRDGDPTDGRRIWIKLTHKAVNQIEKVLSAQAFGGYCRKNSTRLAA